MCTTFQLGRYAFVTIFSFLSTTSKFLSFLWTDERCNCSSVLFLSCSRRGQSRISDNNWNASSSGQCASCSHARLSSQDTIFERPVHLICKGIPRFWSKALSRVSDSYLIFRDSDVRASIANCIATCDSCPDQFKFSNVSGCVFCFVSGLSLNAD